MLKRKITALIISTTLLVGMFGITSYAMVQDADLDQITNQDTEEIISYSYDELIEMAIKNSSSLKTRQKEVERSEIMRDEAASRKTYTPIGHGTTMEEAAAVGALQGLVAADANLAMAKRQFDIDKDKIAYNVKKAFNNLITSKKQLLLDEIEKEIAEVEFKLGNIQYKEGVISQSQLKYLHNNYMEAIKKVEASKIQLENAYLVLNDLVGLNEYERYDLDISEIEDEKEIPALETHIRRMLNNNPNIWMLEQRARLSDLAVSLYTYNVGLDPYSAMEIDATISKMDLSNAKKALELSLRNLYSSLEQIRENQAILEINMEKLLDNLRLAELRLEVGMATPLEVQKVKSAVEGLEKQILQLELQYEESIMIYEKPWVIGN